VGSRFALGALALLFDGRLTFTPVGPPPTVGLVLSPGRKFRPRPTHLSASITNVDQQQVVAATGRQRNLLRVSLKARTRPTCRL
jgi:hypothetical protein